MTQWAREMAGRLRGRKAVIVALLAGTGAVAVAVALTRSCDAETLSVQTAATPIALTAVDPAPAYALPACAAFGAAGDGATDAAASDPSAAEDARTVSAARGCVLEAERTFGPDAPLLLPLFDRLASALATRGDRAIEALPFRRRAHRLAERLYGEASVEAADAALAYARTWIFSGHCTVADPRATPLIVAAATGYRALPEDDARRRAGLLESAAAHADLLDYPAAVAVLAPIAATGREFQRLGLWRLRAGDEDGAVEAYEAALAATVEPLDTHGRARAVDALRRIFFARGELDRAQALDVE